MLWVASTVSFTLTGLAALHVFWGFGGRWGGKNALPQNPDGRPVFQPGLAGCIIVATGLIALACLPLWRVVALPVPGGIPLRLMLWLSAGLFVLRVIGDFRYVGLFRRIRKTTFARMDRLFYTPLCALYATAFILLAW